jgi:rRNA maturation endonuclease Nob1
MGVIDRAKRASGTSETAEDRLSYVCLACSTPFEVQYHSCPRCGSFDVRCAKWVQE